MLALAMTFNDGSMTLLRLATFSVDGTTKYGPVVDGGIVDLSARLCK